MCCQNATGFSGYYLGVGVSGAGLALSSISGPIGDSVWAEVSGWSDSTFSSNGWSEPSSAVADGIAFVVVTAGVYHITGWFSCFVFVCVFSSFGFLSFLLVSVAFFSFFGGSFLSWSFVQPISTWIRLLVEVCLFFSFLLSRLVSCGGWFACS